MRADVPLPWHRHPALGGPGHSVSPPALPHRHSGTVVWHYGGGTQLYMQCVAYPNVNLFPDHAQVPVARQPQPPPSADAYSHLLDRASSPHRQPSPASPSPPSLDPPTNLSFSSSSSISHYGSRWGWWSRSVSFRPLPLPCVAHHCKALDSLPVQRCQWCPAQSVQSALADSRFGLIHRTQNLASDFTQRNRIPACGLPFLPCYTGAIRAHSLPRTRPLNRVAILAERSSRYRCIRVQPFTSAPAA